jgi:hypothetical protein
LATDELLAGTVTDIAGTCGVEGRATVRLSGDVGGEREEGDDGE